MVKKFVRRKIFLAFPLLELIEIALEFMLYHSIQRQNHQAIGTVQCHCRKTAQVDEI